MNSKIGCTLTAILVTVIVICLGGCQNSESNSLKEMSKKWKNDPGGCKGYRNLANAEQMVKDYNTIGKNRSQVIEFFGLPDTETRRGDYTYYLNRKCDNSGKIIQDTLDHCWLNITFSESNTVWQTGISCN